MDNGILMLNRKSRRKWLKEVNKGRAAGSHKATWAEMPKFTKAQSDQITTNTPVIQQPKKHIEKTIEEVKQIVEE
jgi:hypothetical protein